MVELVGSRKANSVKEFPDEIIDLIDWIIDSIWQWLLSEVVVEMKII